MKTRLSKNISLCLFQTAQTKAEKFSDKNLEKLLEIIETRSVPDPEILKILTKICKKTNFANEKISMSLMQIFMKILSQNITETSKPKLSKLKRTISIFLNFLTKFLHYSAENAFLVKPILNRIEIIIQKALILEENEITLNIDHLFLKVFISERAFKSNILNFLNQTILSNKINNIIEIIYKSKKHEKKSDKIILIGLGMLGKILQQIDNITINSENISFINQLTFKVLKIRLKLGSFGTKTLNLISLLLSIGNHSKLPDLEVFPMMKFVFEEFDLNCERLSFDKSKNFVLIFANYCLSLKDSKRKLDMLETMVNFETKLSIKMDKLKTKNTLEISRPQSTSYIPSSTGEKHIIEDISKKMIKRIKSIKDFSLNLIIKSYELEEIEGVSDHSLGISFIIALSKQFSIENNNSAERPSLKNRLSMDYYSIEKNSQRDKNEDKSRSDEKNEYLLQLATELHKMVKNVDFRSFLYETINSKFKLKPYLMETSRQNLNFPKRILRFNIINAILCENISVFKNIFYEILIKIDEPISNQNDIRIYLISKLFKSIPQILDKEKLIFMFIQLSNRFCKLMHEIEVSTDKVFQNTTIIPYFELMSCTLEQLSKLSSCFVSPSPEISKSFFTVWMHLIFNENIFESNYKNILVSFAFFTPNLIEVSQKSFSNQILINELVSNPKVIEKNRRNFKHILRNLYPDQRSKIRNLSLGEMIYSLAINSILKNKFIYFRENYGIFQQNFKDCCFVEMIFCYVRESNLNSSGNLKFVIESIVCDFMKKYIELIKELIRDGKNLNIFSKDFRFILQSSCSINKILLRHSAFFLKEFIYSFPQLAFQNNNLIAFAEAINVLYHKVKAEFESISTIMKSDLLNDKIVMPNNHKELGNILIYLLQLLLQLVLRGQYIENKHFVRTVTYIVNLKSKGGANNLDFGYRYLRYITINFKSRNLYYFDYTGNVIYKSFWLIDPSFFNKSIEILISTDCLDDSLKQLYNISGYPLDYTFDYKLHLNSIDALITHEMEPIFDEIPNRSRKHDILELTNSVFNEISQIQMNIFICHLLIENRHLLRDLCSNQFLLLQISPKILAFRQLADQRPRIFSRKIEDLKEFLYEELFDKILQIKISISKHEDSFALFNKLILSIKNFGLPKVMKFTIKNVLPNLLFSKENCFDPRYFNLVSDLCLYGIDCLNRISSLETDEKTTSSDIFAIHSEFNKSIHKHEILEVSSGLFTAFEGKDGFYPYNLSFFALNTLCFRFMRCVKLVFAIKNFKVLFDCLVELFKIYLTQSPDFKELYNSFWQVLCIFEKRALEKLTLSSVCRTIVGCLEAFQIFKMKNNCFNKEELKIFLFKTLDFGLMSFAKTEFIYKEDIFCKTTVKKSEKMLTSLILACKYLNKENISSEIIEFMSSYHTKKLLPNEKKSNYYYCKQTHKSIYKSLTSTIGSKFNYKIGSSYMKTSLEKSKQLNLNIFRKLLLLLIGNEIDRMKAYLFVNIPNFKNDFSSEARFFTDSETTTYILTLGKRDLNLAYTFARKFKFSITNEVRANEIMGNILNENPGYYSKFFHFLDIYLNSQINSSDTKFSEAYFWKMPHIQLGLKYISSDYEKFPTLQILYSKTLKRLNGEQLLFYLPQIFQAVETNSGFLIEKFLIDFSKKSPLFGHQLIWKCKVEMRIEEKKGTNIAINRLRVQESAIRVPDKVFENMSMEEKMFFEKVNSFFDQVTEISGVLQPSMDKKKKKDIIREKLLQIKLPNEVYMTSNPRFKIVGINFDSGAPMQSHARVPIMVSFYCKRFEGPDKYFEKNIKDATSLNPEEFPYSQFDESLLEEDTEPLQINQLHHSLNPKLFPKENGLKRFNTEQGLPNFIEGNSPKARNQISIKAQEKEKEKEFSNHDNLDLESNYRKKQNRKNSNSFDDKNTIMRKITIDKTQQDIKKANKKSLDSSVDIDKETVESVSCIFKVFDDIRQDNLSLQIIRLFKEIFKKVGLDLFVYPYRTISNRTGKDLDIGGIIECVPNSISRDQMGKTNDYDLYKYFLAKFGQEDSPEFQIARDNFIKSLAAYSVVSYILQIKDRHNGNILVDDEGHIIHIDFGFVFGISPAHNLRFENAEFKLTKEMINIMGGSDQTEEFNYYKDLTIKAFLLVRKYEEHIFNLIKLIYKSGMKCFLPNSLDDLRKRFRLNENDLAAAKFMNNTILKAYNKLTTRLYDYIQEFQNKIHH